MNTFLEQVARNIISKYGTNLARIAIIFPNKRAALFLNETLAQIAQKPIWSPASITISNLFQRYSKLTLADPIETIALLHKIYNQITERNETLDEFYGWGLVMLADFDDIDKNLASPKQVFKNISDLRELDNIDYLTTEQKQELSKFFATFTDNPSIIRERFLNLWSKLPQIYSAFQNEMRTRGLAYEGMLYREAIQNTELCTEYEKYLFVGFNVLQKVEQQLFDNLQKQEKAEFFWDYDEYYLNPNNESGTYIRRWLSRYPNALASDPNLPTNFYKTLAQPKNIQFISAPTENLQARYTTQWLRDGKKLAHGRETAIVLCNETLLPTIIHCIPPEVENLNITTGYPLSQTPIMSLITQLIALQTEGYSQRQKAFRTTRANSVLRHPYARLIGPEIETLKNQISQNHLYYITPQPNTILQPQPHTPDKPSPLLAYLARITATIARNGAEMKDPLFDESLFRMYTLLTRIEKLITNQTLQADLPILRRLINQLAANTTIPFHGEPIQGIQIMGMLETRNIDFRHILILSCNEGNMPKTTSDTSFIPHAIRKAHNLTTIDHKVAIYGYYFHRMIQRAETITILYNNSTQGTRESEMSRFMQQLLVELPTPIQRSALKAGQKPISLTAPTIEKDTRVIEKLDQLDRISPTAISNFLRCQLRFYYRYIAQIKEPDTPADDIDNRIFGNIFHQAAQLMYETLLPRQIITPDNLRQLLSNPQSIDNIIDQAFATQLFRHPPGQTTRPKLNGLQLINREVIKAYLLRLLRTDLRVAPLRVIAHEAPVSAPITLTLEPDSQTNSSPTRTIELYGRIDRLDEINIGTPEQILRVVDYKTGNNPAQPLKTVDEIFAPENIHTKKSDYTLQSILYSLLLTSQTSVDNSPIPQATHPSPPLNPDIHSLNPESRPVAPALLFIQRAGSPDYDPILTFAGSPLLNPLELSEEFNANLTATLRNIFNPALPFAPTPRLTDCKHCPYRTLCGR